MGNLLAKQGYTFEDDPAKAEVIIVNTCGFIRPAREEAIETINELSRKKTKKQILVAAGCMAEKFSDELKTHCKKIDAFLGTRKINQITQVLNNLKSGTSLRSITPQFDMDRAIREGHIRVVTSQGVMDGGEKSSPLSPAPDQKDRPEQNGFEGERKAGGAEKADAGAGKTQD